MWRLIGRFTGFILAVATIFILSIAILFFALRHTLLDAKTYRNSFESEQIFDEVSVVALPAILQLAGTQGDSSIDLRQAVNVVDEETWRTVTNTLLPPNWLQEKFIESIDIILGIVQSDADAIATPIDLNVLANRLQGDEAREVAQLILEASPECNRTQSDQIETLLNGGDGRLPVCRPDDALYDFSEQFIIDSLATISEQLPPDNILVIPELEDYDAEGIRTVGLIFSIESQLILLLFLCPASLVALIVFFAVRSLRGFGLWVGTTSIITAIFSLFFVGGLQAAIFTAIQDITSVQDETARFFGILAINFFREAVSLTTTTLFIFAGIFLVIGFVLLAIAYNKRQHIPTGETVIITQDGQIISTASQQRP